MFNTTALSALNLVLKANPATSTELQKLATKIVQLNLPLLSLNFIISAEGLLEAESSSPDCTITIPLAATSHLIHQDELKTFKTLQIEGDKALAKNLLAALATIDPSNTLYLHQSPLIGLFAAKFEKLLHSLVNYAKQVSHNAGYSSSQYMQYEAEIISDRYALEDFYRQVDELKERCALLAKRVERLNQP
jgi:ubiquinone biosynthesis protein UbiJ